MQILAAVCSSERFSKLASGQTLIYGAQVLPASRPKISTMKFLQRKSFAYSSFFLEVADKFLYS
jgi:hypothetical protein